MGSGNYIIGNHVFVKGGLEAVALYKEAFHLKDKGALLRDGRLFFS